MTIDLQLLIERRSYEEISFDVCVGDGELEIITMDDISQAVQDKVQVQEMPFSYQNCAIEPKSKKWHLGRVIYFINNPHEIKDLKVKNMFWVDIKNKKAFMSKNLRIIDGNHRVMAALYLGLKNVTIQKKVVIL